MNRLRYVHIGNNNKKVNFLFSKILGFYLLTVDFGTTWIFLYFQTLPWKVP